MNCIVPFEKNIKFNNSIAEICSISLEHEINVNDKSLLGNFFIEGEYRTHEVSVNKEKFNYTLPFDVALPEKINLNSLNFEIDNFLYDVVDGDTLNVKIEFLVKADEVEEVRDESTEEIEEEKQEEPDEVVRDEKIESVVDSVIKDSDETFVNYQIHIVRENDTVESVCLKYGILNDLLESYNDIKDLHVGDKLIIPIDE